MTSTETSSQTRILQIFLLNIKGHSPYTGIPHIAVTINGVKCLLDRLDPKKLQVPTCMVPTSILRDYSQDIAPILQVIFQQSLDTGNVPDDWKLANICAVLKKGDRHIAANYRPVSAVRFSNTLFLETLWSYLLLLRSYLLLSAHKLGPLLYDGGYLWDGYISECYKCDDMLVCNKTIG